jgi:hypothetical protein
MFSAVRDWGETMLTTLTGATRFLTVLGSLVLVAGAWAQDRDLTPQQERMRSCNAQAGKEDLKGDERQAFMSECLKAENGERKLTAQQERMKTCNAQAGKRELKGDERQAFMSRCLKGAPETVATSQQERMKSCNAQAGEKDLKGDERREFMSRCLKG